MPFPKAVSVQDPVECSDVYLHLRFYSVSFSLLFSWSSCICLKIYLSLLFFSPISALYLHLQTLQGSPQLKIGKFSSLQEFKGYKNQA